MARSRTVFKIGVPVVLALALLTIYNYGFVAFKGRLDTIREERFVTGRVLARYRAMLDNKPEIEKRMKAMKAKRVAGEMKLIPGKTPALAGASLQERVRGIITNNGGVIRTERITKTEEAGPFTLISASIDATLPGTEALANVLYGIETRTPYMLVESLDVRIKNTRSPGELMVKLGVSGISVIQ